MCHFLEAAREAEYSPFRSNIGSSLWVHSSDTVS